MLINQSVSGSALRASGLAYWELLKPRVTILLTFLGAASAVIASGADPAQSGKVALITLAVFLGSGGSNGLTNYLDRSLDGRMFRTRGRSIPSGRIVPAERALYWSAGLVIAGVALAFLVHPLAAIAGATGTLAAVSFRKTEATHFLGGVSSAAPVAAGWLAMDPSVGPVIGLLCVFVGVWVIHHVWAIMLFYKLRLSAGGHWYLSASVSMAGRPPVVPCLGRVAGRFGGRDGIRGATRACVLGDRWGIRAVQRLGNDAAGARVAEPRRAAASVQDGVVQSAVRVVHGALDYDRYRRNAVRLDSAYAPATA